MDRGKKINLKIKLHMIGKLQTNKVKFAVNLLIIFIQLIVKNLQRKLQMSS